MTRTLGRAAGPSESRAPGVALDPSIIAGAGEAVRATGLDISQWPPAEVRGLLGDLSLLAIAGLFIGRFPFADLVRAISGAAEGYIAARRAEADAARAAAEQHRAIADYQRAQAEALARIQHGRRADD